MEEIKAAMNKLKTELEEFKDKFDEMEVDRNKARNSQRIAEWKKRKALAFVEGKEFVESLLVNIEDEGNLERKDSIIKENCNISNK